MGIKKAPPAWSYSKIKGFDTCPKQFYHLNVLKDYKWPEPTAETIFGKELHTAAEHYIKYNKDSLPPKFAFIKPILDKLRDMDGTKYTEYKMGLNADLDVCEYFDKSIWWRGVIDLLIVDGDTARIIDYKTNANAKYADTGQLELMALGVFKHFPEVKVVKAGLLFVMCNKVIKEEYLIEHESDLWKRWLYEYTQMTKAYKNDVWNPKPSGLCKAHCAILECEHNGRA